VCFVEWDSGGVECGVPDGSHDASGASTLPVYGGVDSACSWAHWVAVAGHGSLVA
jgi:hypothetical protein